MDEDGIIKIGGHMNKAMVPNMAKHQVVSPAKHNMVNLWIKCYHNKKTHNRTKHILSEMREIYWILTTRLTVKKVSKQCFYYKTKKVKVVTPYMSDLPAYHLKIHHLQTMALISLAQYSLRNNIQD